VRFLQYFLKSAELYLLQKELAVEYAYACPA